MSLPIESAVNRLLKGYGFSRQGRTWRKSVGTGVLVVNLQSASGDIVYANLGVYLHALGSEQAPKEHRCHINFRLERVCPPELFESIRSASPKEPAPAGFLEGLEKYGLPWLDRVATPEGVQELVAAGPQQGLVHKKAVIWAERLCAIN